MNQPEVDQLSVLNRVFQKTYEQHLPRRLALLGSAGGNGFEHINPSVTKAVGIDINPDYISEARRRCSYLGSGLEFWCQDLATLELPSGSFDFVFAGLIFEYLKPLPLLKKLSSWISPKGFLVTVLLAYIPFSKIMHLAGVFLSPTRNMASNNRRVRHINPWNYDVKLHSYEEYEDDFREKMVKVGIPVDKPLEAKE